MASVAAAASPVDAHGDSEEKDAVSTTHRSTSMLIQRVALLIMFCMPTAAMAAYAGPMSDTVRGDLAQPEFAVAAETDAQALAQFDVLYKLSANHLNERYRLYAQKAAAKENWRDAAKAFRIAARYADKYSQHRLSMMHWYGIGVAADRVEAYVWSDLAAERGYPQFLAIRERMWRALTPEQQAAVAQRGAALYAEFGDPAAKKRFEIALAQGRRQVTGSHTGFNGGVGFISPERLRGTALSNLNDDILVAKIHSPSRTDPKRYWQQEDRAWKNGMVSVGEIENVDAHTSKPEAPKP
jgi:uncharacterized protein